MRLSALSVVIIIFVETKDDGNERRYLSKARHGSIDSSLASLLLPHSECRQKASENTVSRFDWVVNTGNEGKREELKRLLNKRGFSVSEFTNYDLPEINSADLAVVIHKASQLANDKVLVEDSALDIKGFDIGVNIKWHMQEINNYIGQPAILHSLLAYKVDGIVYAYKQSVKGTIVSARGPKVKGSELHAHFLPDGSDKTLAQALVDAVNPRAKAIEALVKNQFAVCSRPIENWNGAWQGH